MHFCLCPWCWNKQCRLPSSQSTVDIHYSVYQFRSGWDLLCFSRYLSEIRFNKFRITNKPSLQRHLTHIYVDSPVLKPPHDWCFNKLGPLGKRVLKLWYYWYCCIGNVTRILHFWRQRGVKGTVNIYFDEKSCFCITSFDFLLMSSHFYDVSFWLDELFISSTVSLYKHKSWFWNSSVVLLS